VNDQTQPPEFYPILDQCIDTVLSGQSTIDQCVARFPEYANILRRELQTAVLISRLKAPMMSSEAVDKLETRLQGSLRTRPRKTIRYPMLQFSRAAAAILIVFFLALGSGAGLVMASADDLPGDSLYAVKIAWESIILFFASILGQADDVWLHLAQTRLDEVIALDERGLLTQDVLVRFYETTAQAIVLADSDTAAKVVTFTNQAEQALQRIQPRPDLTGIMLDLSGLLKGVVLENGRLQPPLSNQPPSLNSVQVVVTNTPTLRPAMATFTATIRYSETPTNTATDAPTLTFTPTPSDTSTPRIPPTATKTPTLSPTPTETPSNTPSPTRTWTPVPLPGGISPVPFTSSRATSTPRATVTPLGSNLSATFVRQTQQSVFLTQTAGPPATEEATP
jgi:hypothetical protein